MLKRKITLAFSPKKEKKGYLLALEYSEERTPFTNLIHASLPTKNAIINDSGNIRVYFVDKTTMQRITTIMEKMINKYKSSTEDLINFDIKEGDKATIEYILGNQNITNTVRDLSIANPSSPEALIRVKDIGWTMLKYS